MMMIIILIYACYSQTNKQTNDGEISTPALAKWH